MSMKWNIFCVFAFLIILGGLTAILTLYIVEYQEKYLIVQKQNNNNHIKNNNNNHATTYAKNYDYDHDVPLVLNIENQREKELLDYYNVRFLASFLQRIFPKIEIQYEKGLLTYAKTTKHEIIAIPTYHEADSEINKFLSETVKDKSKTVYIIIDGEPNNIPDNSNIDLIFTTKKDKVKKGSTNVFYVPYYVMYAWQFRKNFSLLLESSLSSRIESFEKWKKRDFIVFAYSNDNTTRYGGCRNRSVFYQLALKKLGSRIKNFGNQNKVSKMLITDNNLNQINKTNIYYNNDSIYSSFKFVIAFENEAIRGYVSEKAVNPLFAGAIPVYLGAPDIDEHLNPDCFINVSKYPSFEACLDDLLLLEKDDQRLMKLLSATPFQNKNSSNLDFLRLKGGEMWPKLRKNPLIGYAVQPKACWNFQVVCVTFTYDDSTLPEELKQNSSDSLSECCDEVRFLRQASLPYDFLEKHNTFMQSNMNNNFGFGIWKSVLLLKQLQALCDDDILIFVDSRGKLPSTLDLEHFINLLSKQKNKHLLVKKTTDFQKDKTKKYCLQQLNSNENSYHMESQFILIKKSDTSIQFLTKWNEYCANYDLLKPNTNEHHCAEESIFSCLINNSKQNVIFI